MKALNPRSTTAIDIKIGKNLRYLRHSRKLSQPELGKKLGIAYQQLQRYESGANRISAARLVGIADALNCKIMDLYNGIEERSKSFDVSFLTTQADHRILNAYNAIKSPTQKAALLKLAITLSEGED